MGPKKNQLSELCTIANKLVGQGLDRSEAFTKAWKVIKLKAQMRQGFVEFTYIKISTGEERKAVGTTNPEFINYQAKGGRSNNPLQISYFDKDRNAFRSFKADQLKAA